MLCRGCRRAERPDVGRTGISEAMNVATHCATHHVPVAPHHSVGLGVALAAGLHVAAAVETLTAFEYQPTTFDHANSILRTPIQGDAAHLKLPDGPGLGVEVDEDAVIRAQIDAS
jgi:galactonate dehydratase